MGNEPAKEVATEIEGVKEAMALTSDIVVAGGVAHCERHVEHPAKVLDIERRVISGDLWIGEGRDGRELAVEHVDHPGTEIGRIEMVAVRGQTDGQTLVDSPWGRERVVDFSVCHRAVGRLPAGDRPILRVKQESVATKLARVSVEHGPGWRPQHLGGAACASWNEHGQGHLRTIAAIEGGDAGGIVRDPHRGRWPGGDTPRILEVRVDERAGD